MDIIEYKDNELRGLVLKELYKYRHDLDPVFVSLEDNPFREIIDKYNVMVSIIRQLYEDKLIEWYPIQGGDGFILLNKIRITARGIDVVEDKIQSNITIVFKDAQNVQIGNNNQMKSID